MIAEPSLAIGTLRDAYADGSQTPGQVARAVLACAAAYGDPAVWIGGVDETRLLARAAALEADPAACHLPLYGIPFAVKDNIDALGLPTTAGCPAYAYQPTRNAHAVQKLLDAGAMLVGKTNLDQFATGLVGMRSPYGAPRCVFDPAYISGGSSSGSAVAVAAGLVSFALGTDTAGSGRVPAAFNNIVGLKPTKGLVSTTGVVPACRSLDCVSILARTAADACRVLDVVQGEDLEDSYSRRDLACALPEAAFRFGVLAVEHRLFDGDTKAEALYDAAIDRMATLGGTPVVIDYAPFRDVASLLYGSPFVAERLAAMGAFMAAQPDAVDPIVRGIIAGSANVPASQLFGDLHRLQALSRRAARAWNAVDIMLLPTTPTIYRMADIAADPVGLNARLGTYTNFVNLLDYAAIAVPAGFRPNGLPAGVTLIGPAFSDRDLARLGARLHAAIACGTGARREPVPPDLPERASSADGIELVVAGAHLSGMALNHQLVELGGLLVGPALTAPDYRLLALPGTHPPKPGLVRSPGFAGAGIAVEIWTLPATAFGRFVDSLPPPMAIGRVRLSDGRDLAGFTCEPCAIEGATDITRHGGWRNYLGGERGT